MDLTKWACNDIPQAEVFVPSISRKHKTKPNKRRKNVLEAA